MAVFFSPPGGLTEMRETATAEWHNTVNSYFENSRLPPPNTTFAGPRDQFFNPAEGVDTDAVTRDVSWTAFPRPLSIIAASDEERWRLAEESRSEQVEYCEWSTSRDVNGKVIRITFTCEDRYYFQTLFRHQPETVLALYRDHVSPEVQIADLVNPSGEYIFANRWNANTSTGAMHMIGQPNTIGAAIELAAGASIVRANTDGSLKTGARELILCGRYGDVERHSDPTIGEAVNELTRAGHSVSIANPPELSFESISFAGWETPDGSPPERCWRYTRGRSGHYVRGVLEAPADKGFVVGDIKINEQEIRFGGQVADTIRIKVTGLAHLLGKAEIRPLRGCLGDPAPMGGVSGVAEGSRPRHAPRHRRL
ncbi:hypothetical protein [Sinorhizobium medicae]|uniref:hypothetical protein n=1 Tax=Sinorhizobium medicae TaxID=110321 RepID=UPI000FD85BA7|nr:hypothetical protein [Sinorhizobium medicae]RVJ72530.1 hypothetical protein CN168_26675 [Sinorhizobium medicae]